MDYQLVKCARDDQEVSSNVRKDVYAGAGAAEREAPAQRSEYGALYSAPDSGVPSDQYGTITKNIVA